MSRCTETKTVAKTERLFRELVFSGFVAGATIATFYWYRHPIAPWRKQDDSTAATTLLQKYLPHAEFAGEVSTVIHASPAAIYTAVQQVTLADMPLANWLGTLRYLPARLMGQGPTTAASSSTPFLQYIQSEGGNILLGAQPNQEYAIGAIGKFHDLFDQQFVPLSSPQAFLDFDQPDYQKLAMSFTITPVGDGNRLTLTHGTHALSTHARWKFALYWLAIKPGGNFVTWLMLRAIKGRAEKAEVATNTVAAQ